MGNTSYVTDGICHCGRAMNDSDHCPACGCEIYESHCIERHRIDCDCSIEPGCVSQTYVDAVDHNVDRYRAYSPVDSVVAEAFFLATKRYVRGDYVPT